MHPSTPALFLLTAACIGGDHSAEPPECAGTQSEIGMDEPVGVGVTANEILDFAAGTHLDIGRDSTVDDLDVELIVLFDNGRVLACEDSPGGLTPTGTTGSAAGTTIDRLDMEVRVTLSTSDGRFDGEEAPVFLSATSGEGATGRYVLDALGLTGSYAAPDVDELEVALEFVPGQVFGTVESLPAYDRVLSWPQAAFP